jgi:hypothetical protein
MKGEIAQLHGDLFNLDLRVGLSVALFAAVALLRVHLVNDDLLALAVFHDLTGYGSAGNGGSAESLYTVAGDGQDLVKGNGLVSLNGELFT